MFIHIFAKYFKRYLMARKIDEDKLVRIKAATMKTIVECGIEKTTIAMIAKNANVSGGYLYRIYSGKQALIDELYFDKVASLNSELEFLIELNATSVSGILQAFIQNRLIYALNEPIASKFFYQLLHNDNFVLPTELKERSIAIIKSIKQIGLKTGEISPNTSLLQIHYHILVYVVNFIHLKKTNLFGIEESTTNDVSYLTKNILNILKIEQ